MAELEQVVAVLRATLLSCKGSLTLHECNRDYRELEGEYIPFKKLGYQNLEEFIRNIPGFVIRNVGGQLRVDAIPSEDSKHITTMIAKQKPAKKSAPKGYAPRYSRSRPSPANKYSENYDYNNKFYKQHKPNTKAYYGNSEYPSYQSYKTNNQSLQSYKSNEKKLEYSPKNYERPESKPAPVKTVKPLMSTPVPAPAAQKLSTPTAERKATGLSTMQRLQAAAKTVEMVNLNQALQNVSIQPGESAKTVPVPKRKPKSPMMTKSVATTKSINGMKGAAQRLSVLRDNLSTADTIPLPLPGMALELPLSPQTRPAPAPAFPELPELPPTATAKEKLIWSCKKLELPEPIFKITTDVSKKGQTTYHCVIKVSEAYGSSSYPETTPTAELAVDVASLKVLSKLESLLVARHPCAAPAIVLARLTELVSQHPSGLYSNRLPDMYREQHNEQLPANWQELVVSSPDITSETVACGLMVLLPKTDDKKSEGCEQLRELPPLQLPETGDWNVFVTVPNSTIEVWLRLIGEQYSDAYTDLLTDMNAYYATAGITARPIEANAWYAVQLEEGWHRAQVLEVHTTDALVFLGDHGDEDCVPINKIKQLEPQFTRLPAQAILCRLEGLEELGSCEFGMEIVRNRLVGQVLIAVPTQADDPNEPTVAVMLFQTMEIDDLNLNEAIREEFFKLGQLNISGELSEVEVGCVSQEGQVFVVGAVGAMIVRSALNMLTTPGPFQRPLPAPATVPKSKELYMVCAYNGEWLRCMVRSGMESEGTVSTLLVDSGKTMRVPLSSLIPLSNYSTVLNRFPHQAVAVKLGPAQRVAQSMVSRLRELLLDRTVLCRTLPQHQNPAGVNVTSKMPQVELYVRLGEHDILASVNNAILMEYDVQQAGTRKVEEPKKNPLEELSRKKERLFPRSLPGSGSGGRLTGRTRTSAALPPPTLPELDECVDVVVTMAAHPFNFVVQLHKAHGLITEMMNDLQDSSNDLIPAEDPAVGQLYTVKYPKDEIWYRVVVVNIISTDNVSVYFCDFGDMAVFPVSKLFKLPDAVPITKTLPPQAIKARLYNVTPLHQDWTAEDCVRFQNLCVEQRFVSIVREVGTDPDNTSEPLLTLDLIDVSTQVDIYLSEQLVAERRAKLTRPL